MASAKKRLNKEWFDKEYGLPALEPIKDKRILYNPNQIDRLQYHLDNWKDHLALAKEFVLPELTQSMNLSPAKKALRIEQCNNYIKRCEFHVSLFDRVVNILHPRLRKCATNSEIARFRRMLKRKENQMFKPKNPEPMDNRKRKAGMPHVPRARIHARAELETVPEEGHE